MSCLRMKNDVLILILKANPVQVSRKWNFGQKWYMTNLHLWKSGGVASWGKPGMPVYRSNENKMNQDTKLYLHPKLHQCKIPELNWALGW